MQQIKVTKGIFYPSEQNDIIEALKTYCQDRTFCDLGSGDGRIIEWAKEQGAINPRGIEFEDFATDIKGDLFEHDIMQYEVLFYYCAGTNLEADLLRWIKIKYNGILLLNEGVTEGYGGQPSLDILSHNFVKLGKTKIFNLGVN